MVHPRSLRRVINTFTNLNNHARFSSTQKFNRPQKVILNEPEFDYDYLLNPNNRAEIEENIALRSLSGNINRVHELNAALKAETNPLKREKILESLIVEAHNIPNKYHPDVKNYGETPKVIKPAKKIEFSYFTRDTETVLHNFRLGRTPNYVVRNNNTTASGEKSYFFCGKGADLEHALVKYTLSRLLPDNFQLVSVPDILPSEIIERCGQATQVDERSPVYFLENVNLCLSGTSEMALGGLMCNTVFDVKDLPVLLTAVSRCYRREISSTQKEKGIYRVHQFTKVEMFGITHPDKSDELLKKFLNIQSDNFESLGLDFQILDMNLHDMGPPAYRKYDIEAWFPVRKDFGEISSCTNCTDYQSRRLNIKIKDGDKIYHAHTVNGTACAVPRMIMAIIETHQQQRGNITIPEPLRKYFDGAQAITRDKRIPVMSYQYKPRKQLEDEIM